MAMTSEQQDSVLNLTQLELGKELSKSRCLNLCEVRLILIDQLRGTNRRSPQASTIIQQAYEYAAAFAQIKVRQAVLDVRNILETQSDLAEFEIASLVNLFPKTPEEAKVRKSL